MPTDDPYHQQSLVRSSTNKARSERLFVWYAWRHPKTMKGIVTEVMVCTRFIFLIQLKLNEWISKF